jgi:hypothetical protein
MSFGQTPKGRSKQLGLGSVLFGLLVLSFSSFAAPPGDLSELMAQLAKVRSVSARYTETIQVSLLEHGIESTGTIRYVAPDTLIESLDGEPSREIRIQGDRVRISEADETREIDVGEHRAIESMVAALRSVFTGNLVELERHFHVRFERLGPGKVGDGWHLTLIPDDAEVAWLFSRIEIRGSGREIHRIEIREPNGDSRTMRFEHQEIDSPDG